jgi:hypothetical protein
MTTILDDATYRLSSWWYNGDNHRTYPATLASRTPGFTESWGRDEDEEGKELPSWFAMEQNQLGLVLQQPYPQAPITLFQYHVAWDIQWALRDAKVDFVVVNVPHAFSESTGPLPAWNDLTEPERPILLGHSQQGIFDYLRKHHDWNVDEELSTPAGTHQLELWRNQVESLHVCLDLLRYGPGQEWSKIYRDQSMKASCGETQPSWLRRILAEWNVTAEHHRGRYLRRHIPTSNTVDSAQKATGIASGIYKRLSVQLADKDYLFGTTKPSSLDYEIGGHLMDASGFVPLRDAIREHDNLVSFAQRLCSQGPLLSEWNRLENERNAFQVEWLWLNVETLAPCVGPRDARSVGNHDKYNPWDTWHRWRFGGTFYPASTRAEAKTAETLKLQQDYRHQDQLWWSAVTAASLVSIGVTQWIVSMTTLSARASK